MKLSVVTGLFDVDSTEAAVERAAELGVDGIELGRPTDLDVTGIRAVADEHGIEIARLFASGDTVGFENTRPSVTDPESVERAVDELTASIETAETLGAHTVLLTVGGRRDDIDPSTQHRTLVAVLRRVAPAAEAAGVTVVPEPLNTRVDHPGYYLSSSAEGFALIQAVDSPNVKLLYDIYHQQITEGNVIQTLRTNVDLVGHIHFADVPGRHEPGTGELNFRNIFAAIDEAGYDGFVGAELSPTVDPAAVLRDIQSLLP